MSEYPSQIPPKPHRYGNPESTGAPYTAAMFISLVGSMILISGLINLKAIGILIGILLVAAGVGCFKLTGVRSRNETVTVSDGQVIFISSSKKRVAVDGTRIRRLESYATGSGYPNLKIDTGDKTFLVNGTISDFEGLMDELEGLTGQKVLSRRKKENGEAQRGIR